MRINPAGAIAAVFLCAAMSDPAQAADPVQMVETQVYGAGGSSCGTWLADREKPTHAVELNWVLGFLTASDNLIAGGLGVHLRHTDANAVSAWIDKYCREHPLNNIAYASSTLVNELSKPE